MSKLFADRVFRLVNNSTHNSLQTYVSDDVTLLHMPCLNNGGDNTCRQNDITLLPPALKTC